MGLVAGHGSGPDIDPVRVFHHQYQGGRVQTFPTFAIANPHDCPAGGQIRGDVVRLAGVGGLVEDVNLRRTLLRDTDGALHSVPNGQIGVSSNLTRSWARVSAKVTVGYGDSSIRLWDCASGEELQGVLKAA